ncbi:MAG: MFS transporter [Novosphingobium sp.]
MTPIVGRLPTRLATLHGLGSIAYGVKDSGFSTFLLLYYNQVLGMDAKLVSLALMAALVLDAVLDPVIGHLSDRTHTRWGRRLPWLYLAPLPLAAAWVWLWSAPAEPSFLSLMLTAMVVRALVSCCEVPGVALVPELTRDYDERTRLMRYRFLFGWAGGLLMLFLAYDVLLADGLLERRGYFAFGLTGAGLIVVAVIVSALGQHRWATGLPARVPGKFSLAGAFGEIREALTHPAFLVLLAAGALAYTSQGVTFSLANYLYLFIWRFSPEAFRLYPFLLFASVVLTFVTVGPMHRRWGKRETGAACAVLGMVFWVVPFALRHFGAWWDEGTLLSTAALFGFFFLANWLSVAAMISASSMVADVVEASEAATGRRAEATFFAGNFFMQKCATGLGIFLTGILLELAGMPANAQPGRIPEAVIDTLALSYAVMIAVFAVAIALILRRFPITREDHEARLRALDRAAWSDPDASGAHP